MGIVARQSIKGAIANYIGVAIGFFTTFFVLTDCLSKEEIGLTRVMVDAAVLFAAIAQLGTNASIIRFFPYFKDGNKNHGIFGWSLLIPMVGLIAVSAVLLLGRQWITGFYSERSPLLANYYYLLLPLTFFTLYMTVFETNANVLMRITVPRVVREIVVRVVNLAAYLLYGHGVISLDVFVWTFCCSWGFAMILNFFYLIRIGNISWRIDWPYVKGGLLSDMLRYTLFMTVTIMAGNVPLLNTLFLGAKVGLAATGVYTIGFYIANVVEVPYRSLGAISRPLVAEAVKAGIPSEISRLCKKISLHQFLVSAILLAFIWINLSALFAVIPNGSEYVDGIGVVLILGFAKVVNSTLSISTDVLTYSRRYRWTLAMVILLTASAIAFNALLIPFWEINGAATATLFSYFVYFSVLLLFLAIKEHVNILTLGHLKVLGVAAAVVGLDWLWRLTIGRFTTSGNVWLIISDAVAKSLLIGLLAVWAIYRLRISQEVNAIISKALAKVGLAKISKKDDSDTQ